MIQLENIHKFYRIDRLKKVVLQNLNFNFEPGRSYGILGINGAGKSTLMRILAGTELPNRGRVRRSVRVSWPMGFAGGLHIGMTGRENVMFVARVYGENVRRVVDFVEDFAEIGPYIDAPVKTYSSGMVVRLAFAVAINVDPEILLVDEALAVGDIYFRQRCMRKVHELRARGITIIFVSHAISDVKAIGDRALWLDRGRLVDLGETDRVVSRYLAAMVEKDSAYLQFRAQPEQRRIVERLQAPEVIEHIPNIDHRYGDKRAEVLGITVLDPQGDAVQLLEPDSQVVVRISVRASEEIPLPIVGFMMRNQLGIDFSGTNTAREGFDLPPMAPGSVYTIDFHLSLPELYPSSFSFSPAIADGTLTGYQMCDWIDNAITLQMGHAEAQTYGYMHLPCRVELNARLARPRSAPERKIG
jgi:ABC-type polysaccharide/polyol phosphate transport system ATPase subunit